MVVLLGSLLLLNEARTLRKRSFLWVKLQDCCLVVEWRLSSRVEN